MLTQAKSEVLASHERKPFRRQRWASSYSSRRSQQKNSIVTTRASKAEIVSFTISEYLESTPKIGGRRYVNVVM